MKHIILMSMMAVVVTANAQNKRSLVINKLRPTEQKEVLVKSNTSDVSDKKDITDNRTVTDARTVTDVVPISDDKRVPVNLISVEDGISSKNSYYSDSELLYGYGSYPLLDGVLTTSPWRGNWFLDVQGGASAFLGTPKGCGDLSDRISFCINGSLGKWFTPAIGTRIAYQSYRFKDYNMMSQKYHSIHADLMYNVASHFHDYQDCRNEYASQPRWDVIPYIGAGIMWTSLSPGVQCNECGTTNSNHPFAVSYGVQMRYRLAKRLHVTAEIGGMTTFQNFDGYGSASRIGDNMLSASAGISITIGKVGWHRAVDAASIIRENKKLRSQITAYEKKEFDIENGNGNNNDIEDGSGSDTKTLSSDILPLHSSHKSYRGLESLRNRLKNQGRTLNDRLVSEENAKPTVGTPVYFFFQLNSDVLVDESQLVNLDEIAKIAKEKTLNVHITGAADSATGSEEQNRELAMMRAKYITQVLLDRGVQKEQIHSSSYGGTDMYKRNEENRFTKCVLSEE